MSCLIDTIREISPEWQTQVEELENAPTLSLIIMAAWQLARVLAVKLVEEILAKRAQEKTGWGLCPNCGKRLQSKGFKPRQIKSIIGEIRGERRLGRCANKCAIGQVAPLDKELGLSSNQKSDPGLQQVACLLAIFVPYETAAMLLKQLAGSEVSGQTLWEWVQSVGDRMMKSLAAELATLAAGELPETEAISAEIAAQPLLTGADEVLDDIKAATVLPGLPASAQQSLTKLYNYLDKHRDHIQYDKFKEMGFPIGSGLVESTCKWLTLREQRFKGVGMRWSEDGFNHLLHLRLAWVNGRFASFFPASNPSPKS